jgi:(4-alkanoyl-5-oxo-2,5-dihydrofuran-3-yl)methyl phosphate reductase
MILVTGATGTVGREVIRLLHMSGSKVRALSRNPEKGNFPAGVEAVAGDSTKPETLSAALDGVEKVFWVLPLVEDFSFPQIARQHGVRHIVLLSALAVDYGPENAIAQHHMKAEQAVRESGTDWTFLRPGAFMSNALQWAESIRTQGIARVPFGDIGLPSVDSRDIAAVAAQALISNWHAGKIYSLTGPESMTPRQQVRMIGEALGRVLGFDTIPDDIARENMLRHMPAVIVDAIFDLNKRGHDVSTVLPTVEEVTGRAPIAFKQWAIDHIDAFR